MGYTPELKVTPTDAYRSHPVEKSRNGTPKNRIQSNGVLFYASHGILPDKTRVSRNVPGESRKRRMLWYTDSDLSASTDTHGSTSDTYERWNLASQRGS